MISESVRGEGAILINKAGKRFVNELLPRDILTKEIYKQMKMDDMPYVRLSMMNITHFDIQKRFPTIYTYCRQAGYDLLKEPIPVVPSQHYFMGGIHVDKNSKTSMEHLWAAGETSCNGVHGANRLASNSLLESLVFAERAAQEITRLMQTASSIIDLPPLFCHSSHAEYLRNTFSVNLSDYQDETAYAKHLKQMIW